MGKQHRRQFSALREQLRREQQLALAQLSPAERFRRALDLSDFCFKLAAKGRELRALPSSPQNLKHP